jgi:molecular chaperone GrpE (heat shock protein)
MTEQEKMADENPLEKRRKAGGYPATNGAPIPAEPEEGAALGNEEREEQAASPQGEAAPRQDTVDHESAREAEPAAAEATAGLSPEPIDEIPAMPPEDAWEKMLLRLQFFQGTLAELCEAVGRLQREQEIMQKSLRQLGSRVSEAATSLGAPRIKALYLRLLLLYDLVEPPPSHLSPEGADYCRLLASQIEQFLEVNGIQAIETTGAVFDPIFHKPIKMVPFTDPQMDGVILGQERKGFRTEHGALRPAEVVVAKVVLENGPEQEDQSHMTGNSGVQSELVGEDETTEEKEK